MNIAVTWRDTNGKVWAGRLVDADPELHLGMVSFVHGKLVPDDWEPKAAVDFTIVGLCELEYLEAAK